ncbi:MAG: DUF1829 domain-containing protein [Candidatus Cloacimonetes bacterium]|nr:DUF1829 domain-containing protein [Candidatus Cloacimonadota bacterium]
MINEIQKMLDDYAKWLRNKTTLKQVDAWVQITCPFLDRHNDYLQFYAKKVGDTYVLTDDGYTINDLKQSGCKISTPKRKALLNVILGGFGAVMKGAAIQLTANSGNFALKKHNMVQTMLAVNDMFYLSSSIVSSLFYEDVVEWLDQNEIRYTAHIQFSGKSGYLHSFDFVIPKSKFFPERIIKALTHPDRNTAESLAFAWLDTKEVRPDDSKAYAFLNNTERSVSPSVMTAIQNYAVNPVLWSDRDQVLQELAQ